MLIRTLFRVIADYTNNDNSASERFVAVVDSLYDDASCCEMLSELKCSVWTSV